MTDYLQRLIDRRQRPAAKDPPPARMKPFVPASEADDDAGDLFEEVNELPPAQAATFERAADRRTAGQTLPPAGLPEVADVELRPADKAHSTPNQVARIKATSFSDSASLIPDTSSTGASAPTFDQASSVEPGRPAQARDLSQAGRIEKEHANAPMPARRPFDSSKRDEKRLRQEVASLPPVSEAKRKALPPESPQQLIQPFGPKQRRPSQERLTQPQKPAIQAESPSPAPDASPIELPALRPAADPSLPTALQPEKPRLVIGRLQVDVVPLQKISTPAGPAPRPARRMPSGEAGHRPARSKLRFGLGQL